MSESQQKTRAARHLTVDAGHAGQRIDNFLLAVLKGVPRSYVYRILRSGEVRVNKGRIKAGYRIAEGDSVRIPPMRIDEPGERVAVGERTLEELEKTIIYEDNNLIVIDKPAGIAVHGGSGLNFGVIEALRQLRPREKELELVHRLDRDTSGCLLLSKRRSILRILHELIRANAVDKRYLALLAGTMKQERRTVDVPLLKNALKSGERVVRVDPRGKPSLTRFSVIERFAQCTLVEAQLITGRTHQIRVHAAHMGMPILGDAKYGDEAANRAMRNLGLRRLFLHAESVRFQWPETFREEVFKAPLEPALIELLGRLRR